MTVPYDGEYLRDPRRACGAPSPTGNWCEAVEGHNGEHWFGLSERWPPFGPQGDAEARSGAGEGTDKGEAAGEALEPRWAETGARVIAGEPVPRASDINALIEERDRLREAVKRVRELHQEFDGRCTACCEFCDCLDKDPCTHGNLPWPCPTIQALGEEAS